MKIIDKKNLKNYGVLFWDYKFSEALQEKSGMSGEYTVEYQMHYIAAVGRIQADGQILDVAIPLACVHYEQEVSGAAIEFDLRDVTKATDEVMNKAVEKFEELEKTDFMQKLYENGFNDWTIVPLNSIHTHPGKLLSFSGVDYRKDIGNPGVVFPLSSGTNESNFASIQIHVDGYAELGHTEYRLFNEDKGGNKVYEKGRCLTIIRGYDEPEPVKPAPGPIDDIFGVEPEWNVRPKKNRPDKIIADEMPDSRNKSFENELLSMWKTCDFEPDYSQIDSKNILRYRKTKDTSTNKYQPSLFGSSTKKKATTTKVDYSGIWAEDIKKMAKWLTEELNYTLDELKGNTAYEIRELYEIEKSYNDSFLVSGRTNPNLYDKELIKRAKVILEQDNIMRKEKLDQLTDVEVDDLFMESYGVDINILEDLREQ